MIIVKLVGAKEISLYVVSNIGKKNCSPRAEDQLRVIIQKTKKQKTCQELRWEKLLDGVVCVTFLFVLAAFF